MEKEDRINIKNLPKAEQELTTEEAKEVQGGEGRTRLIIGQDQGVFGPKLQVRLRPPEQRGWLHQIRRQQPA